MNRNMSIVVQEEIQSFEILDFIAIGGESIVFRGKKTATQRPYALKFRSKERLYEFENGELQVLYQLYECSIGKIEGVIYDIPQNVFRQIYNCIPKSELEKRKAESKKGVKPIDPNAEYFCIIEDYIPGCDLAKYCRTKRLTPMMNASYQEVLEFQRKLLDWTIQFCEIMKNVTGKNHVLHLDIKPENIMIMNETEAVVLIDFGMSIPLLENCQYANIGDIYPESYMYEEGVCYGTRSFAAPECCYDKNMRSIYNHTPTGRADERSDIFSFGATLWDCINTQGDGLRIKESEDGYFRRDLFNTPKGYTEEFENIIIKCTEKDPDKRFQSFEELKKAARTALKKMPRTYGNNKVSRGFAIAAIILTVISSVLGGMTLRYNNLTFEIAKDEFDNFDRASNSSITKFASVATNYAEANREYNGNAQEVYEDIIKKAYADDSYIKKDEYEKVLLPCLDCAEDDIDICDFYADTIMQKLPDKEDTINSISNLVDKDDRFKRNNNGGDGWQLAHAVQNVMNSENWKETYETVKSFADSDVDCIEYRNVLKHLIKALNNYIDETADAIKEDGTHFKYWLNAKGDEAKEDAMEKIKNGIKGYLGNWYHNVTGEELK